MKGRKYRHLFPPLYSYGWTQRHRQRQKERFARADGHDQPLPLGRVGKRFHLAGAHVPFRPGPGPGAAGGDAGVVGGGQAGLKGVPEPFQVPLNLTETTNTKGKKGTQFNAEYFLSPKERNGAHVSYLAGDGEGRGGVDGQTKIRIHRYCAHHGRLRLGPPGRRGEDGGVGARLQHLQQRREGGVGLRLPATGTVRARESRGRGST